MSMAFNSLFQLIINVVYALFTAGLAFGMLWAVDKYLLKEIDIIAEVKKGNVAAAVFAGFLLLSICLVMSFTMR